MRLVDFHVGHHDRFGFLALQDTPRMVAESWKSCFHPTCEQAVSKGMERVGLIPDLLRRSPDKKKLAEDSSSFRSQGDLLWASAVMRRSQTARRQYEASQSESFAIAFAWRQSELSRPHFFANQFLR
jgi:hypothetical protein